VRAGEPSRESDHGAPGDRAAPFGRPEFKRTVEHDQQFLVAPQDARRMTQRRR
jgi:hypothetical protein